ncbi:MAG TPA: ferredoxin [Acidimicrobiales bacterium]
MPEPTWSITVDRERCMGTGTCLTYAAGTFGLDPEGKAVVLDPVTDELDPIRTAVEACPTRALSLVEEN